MRRTLALTLAALCPPLTALAQPDEDRTSDAADAIDNIIVTSSRRDQSISDIPRSVRVFDRESLSALVEQTTNMQEILGKAIPGFAPPVSEGSAGSLTLRGREPLYLIDGVPVATNTNFSRFLDKFDPLTIERVEVIYGPTSLYGSGATGGVIQFFTEEPLDEPLGFRVGTQVRTFVTSEDAFDSDGTSPKINAGVNGRVNDWFSLVAYASYEDVNGIYRSEGDLLTGRSQFADDTTFFAKLKFDIAPNQTLTATINQTTLEPSDRFFELSGVDAGDGTIIAEESAFPFTYAQAPVNEFFFASARYLHDDLVGGSLSALVYTSESEFLNPGSDIRAFLGSNGGPFPDSWPGLFQTGRKTDETGLRAQFIRDIGDRWNVAVGADYNAAESDSLLPVSTETGFDDTLFFDAAEQLQQTPSFELDALGLFVEAGVEINDRLSLSGGLRWDEFDYEVVGPYDVVFTFEPGTRPGGSGTSDGTSFNVGADFDITDEFSVFGNYSEGFTIPELGFIGNNVAPGVPVSDSDLIEPVITESIEIGIRGSIANLTYLLAGYYTESEFSTTVSVDPGTGLANRDRAPVEIQGLEASMSWTISSRWMLDASLAWVDGEIDPENDGTFIALSTQDVPPLKISVVPRFNLSDRWSFFGQILYVGDRDDGFEDGTDANPAESYTLVDFGLGYFVDAGDFGDGSLSVQLTNAFNEEYVPAGEATFIPGRIFSGPGRSLTVSYQHRF